MYSKFWKNPRIASLNIVTAAPSWVTMPVYFRILPTPKAPYRAFSPTKRYTDILKSLENNSLIQDFLRSYRTPGSASARNLRLCSWSLLKIIFSARNMRMSFPFWYSSIELDIRFIIWLIGFSAASFSLKLFFSIFAEQRML